MFYFIYKGGRRDLSKLVRVAITDKKGRHTHVYKLMDRADTVKNKKTGELEAKSEPSTKHGVLERKVIKKINKHFKSAKVEGRKAVDFAGDSKYKEVKKMEDAKQEVNEAAQEALARAMGFVGFNEKGKSKVFNTADSHVVDTFTGDAMLEIKTAIVSAQGYKLSLGDARGIDTKRKAKATAKAHGSNALSSKEKGALFQMEMKKRIGKIMPLYLVGIDTSEFFFAKRGYKVYFNSETSAKKLTQLTKQWKKGKGRKFYTYEDKKKGTKTKYTVKLDGKGQPKFYEVAKVDKDKPPVFRFYIHQNIEDIVYMHKESWRTQEPKEAGAGQTIMTEIHAHTFTEAAKLISQYIKENKVEHTKLHKKMVKEVLADINKKKKKSAGFASLVEDKLDDMTSGMSRYAHTYLSQERASQSLTHL